MATKSNTFPESTASTQTQKLTIPNLKSVTSVTVNTGSVSYKVEGDTITFTLSGGVYSRRVQTGGSPGDSKSVSVTQRQTYQIEWIWFTIGSNTNWMRVQSLLDSVPTTYYYNSGGYYGTLSNRTGPTNETYYPPSGTGTLGQYANQPASGDFTYSGVVSRPDTRTYQNYYQYTVTVNYEDNAVPTVTLTAPSDSQVLSEGSTIAIEGTAKDVDSGNVLTAKYKINNDTPRALQSGVSNGSTPISFAKSLTYSNKRLWDGSTDVTGVDLAENTDHTLTVWVEDDQGGKSAEVTRNFQVIWNRPPTISGQNDSLGTITDRPTITYSAVDPEGNTFTFTEYLNGQQVRSFTGEAGQEYTFQLTHDAWIRLDLDVPHQAKIVATDSAGMSSERVYTFTRTETHIEFMLDYDNPDVQAFFTVDGMPNRILVTLERYMPPGSSIESVQVTNNYLDAQPTWEDATGAVIGGRGYLFTNTTKTADDWAVCVWVTIAKGSAEQRVHVYGYGGAFD